LWCDSDAVIGGRPVDPEPGVLLGVQFPWRTKRVARVREAGREKSEHTSVEIKAHQSWPAPSWLILCSTLP